MTTERTERLVKILGPQRMPLHGGVGQWPAPGVWREVTGPLVPCRNGLHVCTAVQAVRWLGPRIWSVEVDGERLDDKDKVVARRARLIAEYPAWTERAARVFAVDCAERVASRYRVAYPDDDRVGDALVTVRRWLDGVASDRALTAAWAAARDAAGAAAWAAAEAGAAAGAAGAAAWAAGAAVGAARAAARDVAWAAAEAWAAARDAWAAASAAGVAAGDAEQRWQADRLWQYLDGEVA